MEFYADEIEVRFDQEPILEKKPGVPSSFIWRGREHVIVELLTEWHDYRKRGKTKAFYKKERGSYWVKSGEKRGSWGVGRDYYRVRTASVEVFEIYYDRAPKGTRIERPVDTVPQDDWTEPALVRTLAAFLLRRTADVPHPL